MIGEKQNQTASDGSLAIQSGRDTNIHEGLSTADMRSIVECMADQLPKYAAIAANLVDQRLKTFEEKVIGKFETELSEHRRAFQDPDFQFLLRSAQTTYCRSGDEQTCDNLVNLIGERSKLSSRDRVALSINAAVERAGVLTKNEFAELSYSFFMRSVRLVGIRDIRALGEFLHKFLDPLLSDISLEGTSYSYLEAVGCATTSMGVADFQQIIINTYPNIVCKNVMIDQLKSEISEGVFQKALSAGILELSQPGLTSLAPLSLDDVKEKSSQAGLTDAQADLVWKTMTRSAMSQSELKSLFLPSGFDIDAHVDAWNKTPLKSLTATSVGIAIGYSNLKRVAQFPADLSIWIK